MVHSASSPGFRVSDSFAMDIATLFGHFTSIASRTGDASDLEMSSTITPQNAKLKCKPKCIGGLPHSHTHANAISHATSFILDKRDESILCVSPQTRDPDLWNNPYANRFGASQTSSSAARHAGCHSALLSKKILLSSAVMQSETLRPVALSSLAASVSLCLLKETPVRAHSRTGWMQGGLVSCSIRH